ncbi:uroporphyrinogen-III synthase [Massilia sp. PAMC28688]|uniref:uroporphyrinogen-III synthase n=1 Tax=Massilia sp. PAMC28688 TaxID=2861283 RepID=UPI001C62F52C|nr:uroporphyrinogen-III synthase [Massilia sp. PAMC28688]QYF93742.1 uroporphyrinogen-III synthase [Massilia sp. PAMC28688]
MPDAVIITRPRAQAGALAQQVAALGREVVLLPLLEISPLPDQSELTAQLAQLARYAMVAFVSPNAIDAAFAHIAHWPRAVTLAVLGEGSRAALARHGLDDGNARIVSPRDPARSDSENLLQSLDLTALAGKEVLIVRGESGRELMADGLRAAGAIVTTVAAYRRRVPAMSPALRTQLAGLLEGENDWIITSSEALRGLRSLVGELGSPDAVVKMQQQHLIVPHARIAETAAALGLTRLTLCGSGDERLLAALQSRP